MPQFDAIKAYTKSICDQVRWKKAHPVIARELENHIADQKDAFMEGGFNEEEATKKAVEQMGDAVTVGLQFDRAYRPKTAWSMIWLVILALILGIAIQFLMVGSSPPPNIDTQPLFYFYRTVLYAVIGVICMSIAYLIDFTMIGKYPKGIFISLCLVILLFPLFGITMNGAKMWLAIPGLGFTISLPAFLLLFPAAYAGIIYCMRNKGYKGILMCGV